MDVKIKVVSAELCTIAQMIDGDPIDDRFVIMCIVSGRYNLPVGFR